MNAGKSPKSQAGSAKLGQAKPFALTGVTVRGRAKAPVAPNAPKAKASKTTPADKQSDALEGFQMEATPASRKPKIVVAALAVVVFGLLVAQFAGGGDHHANPAPFVAAAVADTTQTRGGALGLSAVQPTTGTLSEDSDQGSTGIFNSIIGALRSDAPKQAPEPAPVQPAPQQPAPVAAAPATQPTHSLVSLVSQALVDGQSQVQIAQLLNAAKADGRIIVPDPLLRTDGTVDTDTILLLFTAN